MKEFELIQKYFADRGPKRKDVVLGVGDDAAIINFPTEQKLVVATDTMVEGTHFFPDADPRSVGHKALAVNLSDFAAMGAEPAWASVALTLPDCNEQWVKDFADGLYEIAEYFNVEVIGGDTTKGPLSVTVSLKGFVPPDKALLRSGAKNGDWIYVTGSLGEPALTVAAKLGHLALAPSALKQAEQKFNYPNARLAAAQVLRHAATSAIDVSDGVLQDLGHILKASNVGAELYLDKLPVADTVLENVSKDLAREYALVGGEDYELLFTVPEPKKAYLEQNATAMGVGFTCIGQVKGGESGLKLLDKGEKVELPEHLGYQHF